MILPGKLQVSSGYDVRNHFGLRCWYLVTVLRLRVVLRWLWVILWWWRIILRVVEDYIVVAVAAYIVHIVESEAW